MMIRQSRMVAPLVAGLVLLVVTAGLPGCGESEPEQGELGVIPLERFACERCNIIFINVELLRADFTGLIGNTDLTPEIDRFFHAGLVFHDASAPAGETFLSNTAVQTGLHPFAVDIMGLSIDRYDKLEAEKQERIRQILTAPEAWAETLSHHGYHTISVNQGGRAGEGVFLERGFTDHSQWSSDLLIEDMVDILIDRLEAAPEGPVYALFRPTFLHNYQYRNRDLPKELDGYPLRKARYEYVGPDGEKRQGVLMKRDRSLEVDVQKDTERAIYRAQLRYGDRELARLFHYLSEKYVEDSIIVLYANHGSGLGDNGTFNHGTSYQASIHVPLFILHPNIDSHVPVHRPVALYDLAPSVSAMTGVEGVTWQMIGRYDELLSTGFDTRNKVLVGKNPLDQYIRQDGYKLIIKYGRIRELFDLDEDPGETRNLIDSESARATAMEAKMAQERLRIIQAGSGKQ